MAQRGLLHPFEWLSPSGQKGAFILFSAMAVGVMVSEIRLDSFLTTDAAPQGMISFELAGDSSVARNIVESWWHMGQVYAALSLGLDYLFLVAYASSIGLGCVLVARNLPQPLAIVSCVGTCLAWCQFGAALLDAMENYALIQVLLGSGHEFWPMAARWCAIPKFAIVGAGLAYVALGAVAVVITRTRKALAA